MRRDEFVFFRCPGYSGNDGLQWRSHEQLSSLLSPGTLTVADCLKELRKDSLETNEANRELVRDRVVEEPCGKIIITHGTDTMVENGKSLSGIGGRCTVLTGAMEPADIKSSDAVFNVGVAIGAVSSLPNGVYIAMNGRIFDPFKCRKTGS